MNQVVQVISETPIPSVTHVDNSARIQTVKKKITHFTMIY
jgi:predicted NodU family carbamoyl transferase